MSGAGWPPRYLTRVTPTELQNGDGDYAAQFIESYARVVKDSLGGKSGSLITLRPWQRNLLSWTMARRPDGKKCHRQALIGLYFGMPACNSSPTKWCLQQTAFASIAKLRRRSAEAAKKHAQALRSRLPAITALPATRRNRNAGLARPHGRRLNQAMPARPSHILRRP